MTRILRADLAFVADWIEPGARVLDLGCGDGSLLAYLQEEKGCVCCGVELDDAKVAACVSNGVEVIQQNLEDGLALFPDHSFDTVLELQSLQMVRHTEAMLRAIARIARHGIVTFPNFGYWRHRLAILSGHMPVTRTLPFQWYDTPNLRFSTIPDFADLARRAGFTVEQCVGLHEDRLVRRWPNLRGSLAVFGLKADHSGPAQVHSRGSEL